jgi:hypothetical protein
MVLRFNIIISFYFISLINAFSGRRLDHPKDAAAKYEAECDSQTSFKK